MDSSFPRCPITGTKTLVPICSYMQMHRETKATGVEFDLFWNDSVLEGVAYFFRWLGTPRSTVLVVWGGYQLRHIECRKADDQLLSEEESVAIVSEVVEAFRIAGYWTALHRTMVASYRNDL
ncbi:MAG TPA: hypothetical protein VFB54_17475 [Burkholderiales bacterium]|nr:hypothetical protein [Burkholderiales bacterium]